ncbi:DUF1064 domain-containing protein [Lacticaseibacillus manihotivorans]|uniref:DUF1064 domain-containing protein n=2 Tax=Lacticaseibacillus manihotivorans TaxID=88233 RepID=A0A0R1QK31_9LACO|nr:DUF1064 domain-containing protein [Lacticaseibacillus manihotivorans]KRL42570.1 hypothetical protein FD01_GL001894 [Lacticaseibacillus manihotivorans DSM 13343 = JCM 12514]
MASPTALNKRGTKVCLDGYKFDSQKEADFYTRFVKNSGFHFRVHPTVELAPLKVISMPVKARQIRYTPDFVIFDAKGAVIHVYDVKNSFGMYGIDSGPKEKFAEFLHKFGIPVEAVVVRKHDFKSIAQSVTKKRKDNDPLICTNLNYSWLDATAY